MRSENLTGCWRKNEDLTTALVEILKSPNGRGNGNGSDGYLVCGGDSNNSSIIRSNDIVTTIKLLIQLLCFLLLQSVPKSFQ
jgi:hypothetical protein